jgi:uncharacterized membrane protein YjjP (DUF1212 family)
MFLFCTLFFSHLPVGRWTDCLSTFVDIDYIFFSLQFVMVYLSVFEPEGGILDNEILQVFSANDRPFGRGWDAKIAQRICRTCVLVQRRSIYSKISI